MSFISDKQELSSVGFVWNHIYQIFRSSKQMTYLSEPDASHKGIFFIFKSRCRPAESELLFWSSPLLWHKETTLLSGKFMFKVQGQYNTSICEHHKLKYDYNNFFYLSESRLPM